MTINPPLHLKMGNPMNLNIQMIHPSWQPLVLPALAAVDSTYVASLQHDTQWLPGPQAIFNAFSLPLEKTRFILMGESPYPRADSANGFAFWDARVGKLWSDTGLDSRVNRATSLRNMIKMLLVAEGKLSLANLSQTAIAALDKSTLVQTGHDLFTNFGKQGILLLNASLVLSARKVKDDAKAWRPFMMTLLTLLAERHPDITLLLFGKIAQDILAFPTAHQFPYLVAEHPYNLSFITNPQVLAAFSPLALLQH